MFLRPCIFLTSHSLAWPSSASFHTRAFSMSSLGRIRRPDQASPFTLAVVEAVRKLYPEKLADSSFDNTGLLLEAPHRRNDLNNSVLLTIDLTRGVADEAISRKDSIIVAYHPTIFKPLKSLTLVNSQQSSLLKLAHAGISVYCPHTAVDAAPGGINDWLADILTAMQSRNEPEILHDRRAIKPAPEIPGMEGAGYGRIITFTTPQKLSDILKRISIGLGNISGLSIAVPQSVPASSKAGLEITSVAVCAGSGGSMLGDLDVDMLFTGELSHHEALAAIERRQVVVTAFHSNTERAFLKQRMQQALAAGIEEEIEGLVGAEGEELVQGDFEVGVSKVDRDPFEFVVPGQSGW